MNRNGENAYVTVQQSKTVKPNLKSLISNFRLPSLSNFDFKFLGHCLKALDILKVLQNY